MDGADGGWMAYVGLGGNLPFETGPPETTVRTAALALKAFGRVVACSGLWSTEPVGPVRDQPAFVNGVVALRTALAPKALMERLLDLEGRFGRVRGSVAQGPRTLDLDLLLMEQLASGSGESLEPVVCDEPELQLPHPEMARRRFVLAPLAEIAPGLRHPCLHKSMAELLAGLPVADGRVERLAGLLC